MQKATSKINCKYNEPILGGVSIEWSQNLKEQNIQSAHFVFTELATSEQFRFDVSSLVSPCFHLNPGKYRVTVSAAGLETHRETVEIRPGAMTSFKPYLKENLNKPKTFNDILNRFGINDHKNITSLEVPANTTLELNSKDIEFEKRWASLEIKDIDTAKKFIGVPDNLWGKEARYNNKILSVNVEPEHLIKDITKEYLQGNSQLVNKWKDNINSMMFAESLNIALFPFDTVTINAGATLTMGVNSHIFICRLLRMHATATFKAHGSGPIHIEPLQIEIFC